MNEYNIDRLSTVLKACSCKSRLNILLAIYKAAFLCVSEIFNLCGQSQPVTSQHLATLKQNNIIDCRIQGNKRIYFITDDYVKALLGLMLK